MNVEASSSSSHSAIDKRDGEFDYLNYSYQSHNALCEITENSLNEILSDDKFLNDIPYDITCEEVQAQIAVVKGQSITIYVKREPYTKFKIVIPEAHTTVHGLKKAIKRNYELSQKRLANREHRNHCCTASKCPKHRLQQAHQQSQKTRRSHSSKRNHDDQNLTKISWRYIWRTNYLEFDGNALTDDRQLLIHYGIRNKSVLRFVKKIKCLRRERKQKNQKRT